MPGGGIRRVLAEWPLLAAALALLSLALIPRIVRPGPAHEPQVLDALRRAPPGPETEAALRAFLAAHPRGPQAAEARLLLARSVVGAARAGAFPGLSALQEAWTLAASDVALREEIARESLARGLARAAVDQYTELAAAKPEHLLNLARALGRLAEREPQAASDLLGDAGDQIDRFVRATGRRLDGILARAEIYRRAGRAATALEILERAAPDFPDVPSLSLERARALRALGRETEAFMAATDAAEDLPDGPLKDQARLLQAILQLPQKKAPVPPALAPLADLEAAALAPDSEALASALRGIAHPAYFEDHGFDAAAFARRLRVDSPDVFRELVRLYPATPEYRLALARALRRGGRASEAAEEFLAAGALATAAETAFEASDYERAAELYRRLYESDRARHVAALARRGESLARSGRTSEALEVYAEASAAGDAADRRRAVVLRGTLLASLGRREEAAREFDRVLKDPDLGAEPRDAEWARALLERGRALLETSRAEGRRALEEYLERYGEGESARPDAAEAAYLLVRAGIEDRAWERALAAVERVEKAPGGNPAFLKEARFLKGDVLAALGRWEEAERAYADAYRAYIDTDDRLWGLIGRARALARLKRLDEARRTFERGLALYRQNRERYDRSFEGHGARAWGPALQDLAKELK
jgi:tetratricopeptide (TPR) repeat protein